MNNKDGTKPKQKDQHPEQEEMRKLLTSAIPAFGDYREPTYASLVHQAVDVIYKKVIVPRENDRHKVGFAACCQVWDENRRLEDKGHSVKNIKTVGIKHEMKITTKHGLLKQIIGEEPYSIRERWVVQFPRVSVQCGFSHPVEYSLLVVVSSFDQAEGYCGRVLSIGALKAFHQCC